MLFGEIAEMADVLVSPFVVEKGGHVRGVPTPAAHEQQRIGIAHFSRQSTVSSHESQYVLAQARSSPRTVGIEVANPGSEVSCPPRQRVADAGLAACRGRCR